MNKRRYYLQTEEVTTVKKKAWIELDLDFTQVYDCFLEISSRLHNGTSWKILFWLLSKSSEGNGITTDRRTFENFSNYLSSHCKECSITRRTFDRCIDELVEARALTRVSKGFYYLNPYMFWKDGKTERIEFIEAEIKDGNYLSYNPVSEKKKEIDI